MKLKIIKMKKVKSTNNLAMKLIKKDYTKPTLISALIQTNGRGTMGKKWISQKGNLFISIFFKFDPNLINFKQFAILNAYLIKSILMKKKIKRIKIKWPNDILVKKEKICGILQEVINHKSVPYLIIGIGINTNTSPSLKSVNSTSLKVELNKKINNDLLLNEIKKKYEKFISQIKKYNFSILKKKLSNKI